MNAKLTAREAKKLAQIAECLMNEANGKPENASQTYTWLDMHGGSKADGGLLASLQNKGMIVMFTQNKDKREHGVQLTEAGFAAYKQGEAVIEEEAPVEEAPVAAPAVNPAAAALIAEMREGLVKMKERADSETNPEKKAALMAQYEECAESVARLAAKHGL